MPKDLIVLDRDGVINQEREDYIRSPDQFKPIPGSIEAIVRLSQAGYTVCVATNQSGIGRGLYNHQTHHDINSKLLKLLDKKGYSIDGIWFCPHTPDDDCNCRKPSDGLLLDIARRYKVEPQELTFVGDSFRDIQAAQQAGAKPVLVMTGNGLHTRETYSSQLDGVTMYRDLAGFAQALTD